MKAFQILKWAVSVALAFVYVMFTKLLPKSISFSLNPILYTFTEQDLKNYAVNTQNAETIWQPLYDFQLYPLLGQQQMTFFQEPQGQGITTSVGATVGSPKTRLDTNMTMAGQLSRGTAFIVAGIEVYFYPGSSDTANEYAPAPMTNAEAVASGTSLLPWIEDVQQILNAGGLQLFILQKEYCFAAPLHLFPPSSFVGFDASLANSDTTTHNMVSVAAARVMGRPFVIDPPCTLVANQNFKVTLEWGGAFATPSGFNGRIGVGLIGQFFRNAQ